MELQDKRSKQTIARSSIEWNAQATRAFPRMTTKFEWTVENLGNASFFLLFALHGRQQNWKLLFLSVSLDLRMKHGLHNMWHVRPNLVSGFQRPNATF